MHCKLIIQPVWEVCMGVDISRLFSYSFCTYAVNRDVPIYCFLEYNTQAFYTTHDITTFVLFLLLLKQFFLHHWLKYSKHLLPHIDNLATVAPGTCIVMSSVWPIRWTGKGLKIMAFIYIVTWRQSIWDEPWTRGIIYLHYLQDGDQMASAGYASHFFFVVVVAGPV